MTPEAIAGILGAVVGSILTGFVSWRIHKTSEYRQKREELRDVLLKLVQFKEDYELRIKSISDQTSREQLGGILNEKRMILKSAAEALERQIRSGLSPGEYITLGNESWGYSDFDGAEGYYQKAVKASIDSLNKSISTRTLALFFTTRGPHQDFRKAEEHFQQAIECLSRASDDYSIYTLGLAYESWGGAEEFHKIGKNGRNLFELAKAHYSRITEGNPLREDSLIRIKAKLEGESNREQIPPTVKSRFEPTLPSSS